MPRNKPIFPEPFRPRPTLPVGPVEPGRPRPILPASPGPKRPILPLRPRVPGLRGGGAGRGMPPRRAPAWGRRRQEAPITIQPVPPKIPLRK